MSDETEHPDPLPPDLRSKIYRPVDELTCPTCGGAGSYLTPIFQLRVGCRDCRGTGQR